MTADLVIAPLRSEQVPAAQLLLAASFEARLQPYMTATQAGAEGFLAAYIAAAHLHPDRLYLGASQGGELVGYAEFRRLEPQTGFLSYICVSPLARGQGVASRLIRHYLTAAPGQRSMQLDVFADNAPALALYRKLGFKPQSEVLWWRRPLPAAQDHAAEAAPAAGTASGELQLQNWPQALAMQRQYGFCEYQFTWQGQPCQVGRMGQSVLRCTSAPDFANDRLLGALRAAFPELREALLIAPTGPAPSPQAEAFNRSLRLVWDLSEALEETP